MSKAKKVLLMCTVYVLVAALAITGTVAWLTWEESDVNVMTVGNVEIDQLEYERVVDEKGNPVLGVEGEDFTENYGITQSYKLKAFTPGKAAYPAVYTNGSIAWDEFQQLWNQVGAPGSNDLFDDSMKNVIDKFVFVENTGKSDAYYRTIIAIECPEGLDGDKLIHVSFNANSRFDYNDEEPGIQTSADANAFYTTIEGVRYLVYVANYTEILEPGEVSRPSLLQVYLDPATTNEDCALFGETWDILVKSQAVQAAGFENARSANMRTVEVRTASEIALDSAFYDVTTEEHPWIEEGSIDWPILVDSVQELKDAMLVRGANIVLNDDIIVDADTPLQWGVYMFVANGREVTIDLNGKTITVEEDASLKTKGLFTTANGGTLNIVGDGTVEVKNGISGIFHAMNKNDQINVYGGTYISNSHNDSNGLAIIYTNSGNVDVYGGVFCPLDGIECANAEDIQGNRLSIVFHEGAILKHTKYYAGSDATRIQLAEGCELKAVVIDGQTWYQVAAK